jgi:hypothetical protein
MIELSTNRNPRYTIWRALNPDAKLYEIFGWIREQWAECRKEIGARADHPSGHQSEFTAWLCKRHGATYGAAGQAALFHTADRA